MNETTHTDFPYKTQPYKHQHDCFRLSRDRAEYAYFMEMGCLSGHAQIQLNWFGNSSKITLKQLFDLGLEPRKQIRSGRAPTTRSLIGDKFGLNRIISIAESGTKDVVELLLASGRGLILTPDHEVMTTQGWSRVDLLTETSEVLINLTKQEWDERKLQKIAPRLPCSICGNPNSTTSCKSRYFGWCRSCIMKHVSKNSDGRTLDKDGYIRIGGYHGHPRANKSGQVLEHIIVMEQKLGRPIENHERVHHQDEDTTNNEPGNLELTTKNDHHLEHSWYKNLRQDVFTPFPDKVAGLRSAGRQDTYDLIMSDPARNFIANGIVVHNCGKSKVLIDTAAYQYLDGRIKSQIVVAPKGVYLNWVDNEIPTHLSDSVERDVAYWSAAPRAEERDNLKRLMDGGGNHMRLLFMNVEAFTDMDCAATEYLAKFLKKFSSGMAVDESTTIKNPKAHRTKVLTKLAQLAKYRRILSGNPIPNGPMDIWSQAEFLKKYMLGFSSYYGFRNRFAVMHDMRYGNRAFQKIVGYKDVEVLTDLMRKFSFIIKKVDCLDLPSKLFQVVDVEMSSEQKRAYNNMRDESFIMLEGGAMCTADMVMTQLTRLHQIACGFLSTNQGELGFDDNPRMEALLDLLEQCEGKAIIWATYRYNIIQIKRAIEEKFGKETLVDFWGDTPKDDRREATRSFQDVSSKVRFMLSNPATGKFGNTWTRGATVIYYSNDYNLEHREQSEDRAHRIGQERDVTYIDLRVRGTVDDRILKILKSKKKLTDQIVSSNWKWLLGERAA